MEIKSEMDIGDAGDAFKLILKALYKFYGEPLEQTNEKAKDSVTKDPRDAGYGIAEFVKTGVDFYLEDIGIVRSADPNGDEDYADEEYERIYKGVIDGLCEGLKEE